MALMFGSVPYTGPEFERVTLPRHRDPRSCRRDLVFGNVRYTGLGSDRVTLPWHQGPRIFRQHHHHHHIQEQSSNAPATSPLGQAREVSPYRGLATDHVMLPQHQAPPLLRQRDEHTFNETSPHPLYADGSIRPFFLRSYCTRNLDPISKRNIQLLELTRLIATLRLLGYELQPSAPITYGSPSDASFPTPSLTFFHHFTDPNERLMSLIANAHLVVEQLQWCLGEEYRSEEVEAWKKSVYEDGWRVCNALRQLKDRFARAGCVQSSG